MATTRVSDDGGDDRSGVRVDGPRPTHVEMSWFVSIVHDNVLETFSNFFHGIRIRYGDNSTSFMIFRIRSHFIQLKTTPTQVGGVAP